MDRLSAKFLHQSCQERASDLSLPFSRRFRDDLQRLCTYVRNAPRVRREIVGNYGLVQEPCNALAITPRTEALRGRTNGPLALRARSPVFEQPPAIEVIPIVDSIVPNVS